MLQIFLSFVISLFIGLLIGIEREHSHLEGIEPIGIRTFILFALLGTLAATLHELALTLIISVFVFSIILLGYFQSTKKTKKKMGFGITTEVSAGIVFCIGYLIPSSRLLAAIISALVLLVLIERQRLHILARKKFKPHTIETAIIFIIFILGILPILPNRIIDPWGLFNPYYFGILIVTLAAIQFIGFVSIRLFGERFGMAMTGLLGGFISSTLIYANLSRLLKEHSESQRAIIASAIIANLAMLIEVSAIIFVASPHLLLFVIKPIVAMVLVSIVFAIFLLHFQESKKHVELSIESQFSWSSLFRTTIFIGLVLTIVTIAKHFVGTNGLMLISFLGGLFEIHGITLATALLYLDNQLTSGSASLILYVALLATFISKFILLWSTTPRQFALRTSLFLLGILLSGGVTFYIFH